MRKNILANAKNKIKKEDESQRVKRDFYMITPFKIGAQGYKSIALIIPKQLVLDLNLTDSTPVKIQKDLSKTNRLIMDVIEV